MEKLAATVEVRCLSCGTAYGKPVGRGTVRTNPGCPACGYLGWSPVREDVRRARETGRSGVRPPRRLVG